MRNCKNCQKNFKNEVILAQHMRDVHEEKTFECEICAKSFSRKQTLEEHVSSVHKKLKPFKCEICKKEFARKTQLNGHIRVVHEKIKPYKCTVKKCKFAAEAARNLKIHISEVHERNKPFKCEICNKSFARKSHLEHHLNRKNNCQKYSSFYHKSIKDWRNQFKKPIDSEKNIQGNNSSKEKVEKFDNKINKSDEWSLFIRENQVKEELDSTFSESPKKDPLKISHSESIKKEKPVESLSYVKISDRIKDEGIVSFCSDASEINQLALMDKLETDDFQKDQKVSGYFSCALCDLQFDKVKDIESHISKFHKVTNCNLQSFKIRKLLIQ